MQYILSVSEINKYVREIISKDLVLSSLWVKGELSNFKYHSSGHMYFTLKDEKSLVKCVMFKSCALKLKFEPESGMRVVIRGYISVYERGGQYQLYAEEMQPDGMGSLHMAFEQLKSKLNEEGLFSQEHKKKIPLLPSAIGVATSITGSVIRDILHVLARRYNNADIKIIPIQVQGEAAARQISKAICKFNELNNVEVIILARGGGSLEELWPFNEEVVARSIFESRIPVISAVGHETDYTISDFAADLRAPTPSAAAELVMPEKEVIRERIKTFKQRLGNSFKKSNDSRRIRLEKVINSHALKKPYDRINQERVRLDVLSKDMYKAMDRCTEKHKSRTTLLIQKLNALSPLGILARGYGIVKSEKNGEIIRSIEDIDKQDRLELRMSDGILKCTVNGKRKI